MTDIEIDDFMYVDGVMYTRREIKALQEELTRLKKLVSEYLIVDRHDAMADVNDITDARQQVENAIQFNPTYEVDDNGDRVDG